MFSHDRFDSPPLPVVRQPRGAQYFLGTWSGRLILLNTIVYLVVSFRSGAFFLPDMQSLLDAGAKDPVRLASGEFWRLVTPMFLHVGLIHFLVNSYVLYAIGYQLENLIGPVWYVAVYFVAGVAGNVASALATVNLSAGASGAIFGLLGVGFYLERLVGSRIQEITGRRAGRRVYAVTVMINLVFGLVVPFIDNAAHIGGLVAGILCSFALVRLRPNSVARRSPAVGYVALGLAGAFILAGGWLGTRPDYVFAMATAAGDRADDPLDSTFHYSQALAVRPFDLGVRIRRARSLFLSDRAKLAYGDIREALEVPGAGDEVARFADELETMGKVQEAWQVRMLLQHHRQRPPDSDATVEP